MPVALVLAAILLGQTEAPSISDALVAPSPRVGKGHFTLGTNGSISYLGGTGSTFSFSLGVSGGYFVHDRVLLGANLGFSLNTYFPPGPTPGSTTVVGIPFGVFGQYWHPLGGRLYLFAGAAIGLSPSFGGVTFVTWTVTPRVGLAIFLTDWLCVQPSVSAAFSGSGTGGFSATVGLGWGMGYFI